MYVAGPPVPAPASSGPSDRIPLPLTRVVTRAFGGGDRPDRSTLRFLADLAEANRLPYDPEQAARERRTTFTEMVARLPAELGTGDDPVDLVVIAHGVPDAEPRWPACYLTGVLPGQPLAFAVADQGVVTPFTALQVAGRYLRVEALRRAVVVVLDQASVLRDRAAGPRPPTGNRLVALVLEPGGTLGEVSVWVTPEVAGDQLAATVRDRLPAGGDESAVVVGAQLAARCRLRPGAQTVTAPDGLPCTGPWAVLAGGLDRWRSAGVRQVVLADYDPSLRYLAQCTVTVPGTGSGAP